ncbi:MAG TPA: DUF4126 family protein [Chthoniobacterales bacterium]|nr:DUF4126 family protein [Chthoniobacterales bacterium]
MNADFILFSAFGIGVVAGLRSLTAPAAVSWAAYLGWLNLQGSPLAFMGSIVTVAISSLLAIGELGADLSPRIPKRTAPGPLAARFLMGGLCGASLCASAGQSLAIGSLLGAMGGLVGAFAGYEIRKRLVTGWSIRDVYVALTEDAIAIGLACFLVTR